MTPIALAEEPVQKQATDVAMLQGLEAVLGEDMVDGENPVDAISPGTVVGDSSVAQFVDTRQNRLPMKFTVDLHRLYTNVEANAHICKQFSVRNLI